MTADGRTVVMCTHLLLEAEGLADQVVVLEDGADLVDGHARRADQPLLARRRGAPRRRGPGAARPRCAAADGVRRLRARPTASADGPARRRAERVPDLVLAPGRRRRAAHPGRAPRADARGPLLRRPRRRSGAAGSAPSTGAPSDDRDRPSPTTACAAAAGPTMWTVARTDLKQLAQARDFWVPMVILGGIFFVFVPTVLLLVDHPDRRRRARCSSLPGPRGAAPSRPRQPIQGDTDAGPSRRTRWPSTCSPRSPWSCRSPSRPPSARPPSSASASGAPASSWPTPPPAIREIYLGKLIASLVPGYAHDVVGLRRSTR